MNKLESIEARVLYIIYSLYQNNSISLIQKGLLKDYLIAQDNSKFMNAIMSFRNSQDIDQLSQFMVKFVAGENSFSDYVSVDSFKTIKSSMPLDTKETTQSQHTNSNPFIICSPVLIRKSSAISQFAARKERKCLTQLQ